MYWPGASTSVPLAEVADWTSSKPPMYSPTLSSSTSSGFDADFGSDLMSASLLNTIISWTSSPVLTTSKVMSPAGAEGASVMIEYSLSVTVMRVDACCARSAAPAGLGAWAETAPVDTAAPTPTATNALRAIKPVRMPLIVPSRLWCLVTRHPTARRAKRRRLDEMTAACLSDPTH